MFQIYTIWHITDFLDNSWESATTKNYSNNVRGKQKVKNRWRSIFLCFYDLVRLAE